MRFVPRACRMAHLKLSVKICKICSLLKISVICEIYSLKNHLPPRRESKCGGNFRVNYEIPAFAGMTLRVS